MLFLLDQGSTSIKDEQKKMTTEDLCRFLKEYNIPDKYIELLRKNRVNGSVLARYDEDCLEDLGIKEKRIRKDILGHFDVLS